MKKLVSWIVIGVMAFGGAFTSGTDWIFSPARAAGTVTVEAPTPAESAKPADSALPQPPDAQASPSPEPSEVPDAGEEAITQDMFRFLKAESPHTDAEIQAGLMIYRYEETDDLGLYHFDWIQGRCLGCLETSDKENLLAFFGVKTRKKKRFVTAARIPLYAFQEENTPLRLTINSNNKITAADIPKKLLAISDRNVVFYLYSDKITKDDLKKAENYGPMFQQYIKEMKEHSVYYARSLCYKVYRNKAQKLEFKDPKYAVWIIEEEAAEKAIQERIDELIESDATNIPIFLGCQY